MNKNLGILALVFLANPSVNAVNVTDCPQAIHIESSGLVVNRTLKQVVVDLSYSGDPADLEEEEIQAVEDSIAAINARPSIERSWSLKLAKNGLCRYESDNTKDIEKAEIYTKGGKDTLLFQTNIGPRGILVRFYAKIERLSPTEVKIVGNSAGMALAVPRYPYENYSAGGPLVFIGKASNLQVSTN